VAKHKNTPKIIKNTAR